MYISCKERLCIYDANAHDVFPLISNTITNTKYRSHTIISTTMFFPLLPLLFLPPSAAPTNPPTTPLYICTDASFASIAPCTKLWIQVSKCRSSPHPFPPHHHPPSPILTTTRPHPPGLLQQSILGRPRRRNILHAVF